MLDIRAGIHKTLVRIANREDPDQTAPKSSLLRVCPVCLGLYDLQLVFEILEHLSQNRILRLTTWKVSLKILNSDRNNPENFHPYI